MSTVNNRREVFYLFVVIATNVNKRHNRQISMTAVTSNKQTSCIVYSLTNIIFLNKRYWRYCQYFLITRSL